MEDADERSAAAPSTARSRTTGTGGPAGLDLSFPRAVRSGTDHVFLTHWQVVGPCERHSRARRLAELRPAGRARGGHARARRRGAGLPQPLPPSRRAGGGRRRRAIARAPSSARSTAGSTIWTAPCAARRSPTSFGEHGPREFGLKPIEMEVFHGFIFLRFQPGPQPDSRRRCWPLTPRISPPIARRASLPVQAPDWSIDLPVNWKSVRDVDNEGYHVADGPSRPCRTFTAATTATDYLPAACTVSPGSSAITPGRRWSVRNYVKHRARAGLAARPAAQGLDLLRPFPQRGLRLHPRRRSSSTRTSRVSGQTPADRQALPPPDEDRAAAARALSGRCASTATPRPRISSFRSGRTNSMKSSAFDGFHLSDLEYGLRAITTRLRDAAFRS